MKNITQFQLLRNARLSSARRAELRAKVEKVFAAFMEKLGLPGRQLTKKDFFRICKAEEIRILNYTADAQTEKKMRHLVAVAPELKGCFSRSKELKFVFLRSLELKKFDRFTAFHELGHYFLDHLATAYRNDLLKPDPEHEYEADYFALLALKQAEVWQ